MQTNFVVFRERSRSVLSKMILQAHSFEKAANNNSSENRRNSIDIFCVMCVNEMNIVACNVL